MVFHLSFKILEKVSQTKNHIKQLFNVRTKIDMHTLYHGMTYFRGTF